MGSRFPQYVLFIVTALFIVLPGLTALADKWEHVRNEMVEAIEEDVQWTASRTGRDELDKRVMQAMATVPRHLFVPEKVRDMAYKNRPLPIGYGQTISQPYIVALMTDLLRPEPDDRVLEIGTGSAYQAAILSELVSRVYTVEIIPQLAEQAKQRVDKHGYDNVIVVQGDGYYGMKEHAPFDGIIVTAAASHVPPPLVRQLRTGGVMVIPVGGPFMTQELLRLTKEPDGSVTTEHLLPVAFVPLTGGH